METSDPGPTPEKVHGTCVEVEGGTKTRGAARLVGEMIGERAKSQGIESVVFDRGGYLYHGRVREVAEGSRSKGLKF